MLEEILKKERRGIDFKKDCNIKILKRLYFAAKEKHGLISIIIESNVPAGAFLF